MDDKGKFRCELSNKSRTYKMLCRSSRRAHHEKLVVFFLFCLLTASSVADSLQPPRFIVEPSSASSIVAEGGTKILQCHAQGFPQPRYKWLKDGRALGDFTQDRYYKIISTSRADTGSYQCIAENDVGSIFSKKIHVTVAYMGVFLDQSERAAEVQAGRAAVLQLPPLDSDPPPLVSWMTADSDSLPYSRKFALTADNRLVVLAAEKADENAYRARATNTQLGKEENSAFIRLVVSGAAPREVAPEIIVKPRDMHVEKGQASAQLQCIANAKPLHVLETLWFKDDILIDHAGIDYSFDDPWNRTLSLLGTNTTHTGSYKCQARLRSGEFSPVTASANVVILEKPSFNTNLRIETLGEYRSTLSLPCEVVGVPKPNIVWFRNTERVEAIPGNRFSVAEDGSLEIKSLRMEDSGMFQCLAANEAGEGSIYTWLKVKITDTARIVRRSTRKIVRVRQQGANSWLYDTGTSKPVIEVPPQNLTVLDGKDATISCRAVGAPTPNVSWTYQDAGAVELSGRVQVLEQGDLLLAAVRESDVGKYTCLRANEAGNASASGYLSVLVRTQIIQPPVDTRVLLGQTATLQCRVSSDPSVPYRISWQRNNEDVDTSSTQRVRIQEDGTLEIRAVRASDVADYTCAVVSPGGNETRSARLSVVELPYAPASVLASRLESVSPRAVNVSWTPGFDGNSPLLKFIVQKREVGDLGPLADPLPNWVTELSNVSAQQRWVLLTSLKAATSYQFRVSAVNSVGEGSASDSSNIVSLPQEPPSGPPLGLVGSARSSSEIITQWQPPQEELRNGQVLGYVMRYKLYGYDSSPWTYQNITNEAQRTFLIKDLITWKDYIIQIAAYNNMGVGMFSDGVKIKTKEGVPEAAPSNVRAEPLNSTAVQVWWEPPNPQKINGINQGYKLQAWKGDPTEEEEAAVTVAVPPSLLDPLAEQSAVVAGLEKYTEYNITVLCFTDPGDGQRSEPVPVRTDEDLPGEVGSLQFDDISDRAVKVIWTPPRQANGILHGYQLKYMVKDKPETIRVENLTSETLSILVNSLQATTHYRFEVSAWTSVGVGPPRVATIQSGIEPVLPGPPTKLAVSNIEAFSVVLQFTPGFDGNSSITKWTVEAQTARNATWVPVAEVSDPDATTLTVTGLVPFTLYKLRITASNVVGASGPSEPTKEFQTIQAPPAHPPRNVTVRAMSATELRVRWIPLQQVEWFGNPRGYNISYREVGKAQTHCVKIEDHTANSHVLERLEEFAQYEILMQAFNDVGSSAHSPVAVERTRESVPSFGPMNVEANATSSTTIVVKWGDVPREHQNGIIEGYKVYYGSHARAFQYKNIPNNKSFTTTLTELRKFVQYHIQVLACTRLGDGALSTPPVSVQTFEDAPGPPSNVSFPDVSLSMARIIWDVPEEPNGEILAYKVTYHLQGSSNLNYTREFPPSDRTYRVTGLQAEQYYMFSVTAQTRTGWGKTAHALVFTTSNRERPQPPSAPQVSRSQVQSEQITFSWTPGRDGFAPLRYYTVQYSRNSGPWQTVPERVDPQVTSYTVTELKPFTAYQFRIQATNDIGPSGWSAESGAVQTLPAAPSKSVSSVKVVPITTNSVKVQWEPVETAYWNGDFETGGYQIVYQPVSDYPTALQATPKKLVPGITVDQVVLSDLSVDRNYEIVVVPYNSQGGGPASPPVTVYVGEAVPTGRPRDVLAEAVSPTEVRLRWRAPRQNQQNGDLLGYKIFYLMTETSQDLEERKIEEELEVVPASYNSHSLVFLDKFTEYRIEILAFNPAGDGPRSSPVTVKTFQGVPGPPRNLSFSEITMSGLKVSWDPPKKRNGEIIGYVVTYETAKQNESFSKQVKQKVSDTSLLVQSLEEEVTYTFHVRAQTIDLGPSVSGNVTTGPQDGSPMRPKELTILPSESMSSVDLHWINGPSGQGPILGYYVQSQKKADDKRWQTITKTSNGPLQDFTISYQNLLPSTSYTFRVIAYNKYGISYPALADKPVITPSKLYLEYGYLQQKPFYRQTWFMVSLAAASIIIIIMIIAVLCVKSKSYKYKQEAQKVLEESMAMDVDDRQDLGLYRSHRLNATMSAGGCGTLGKRGTLGRKSLHQPPGPPMLGKSPPRPSPASVAYHSDEESLKGYDENPDDSSVTEKQSEISSTDSQGSESENDSVRSDPHSFVNHYANINDSLRQSWEKQKPVRNYSSYTDSEPEGSTVMSLNGGQIVMNNMARSRAPAARLLVVRVTPPTPRVFHSRAQLRGGETAVDGPNVKQK
ncbi:protein sidekick isoform X2 [Bacillus rossius redtenbacheri]|uniref:protein sidekick isoform X2 n=1 Tax=Bacillus rossius redtenbacheri TaxID=93214 RepID=UPI002FDDADA0